MEEKDPALVDLLKPEIRENRMVQPEYVSTDKKGQPFHVDAEWAKKSQKICLILLILMESMYDDRGETFELKPKKGHYDSETKVLNLEGNVTLTSTDGYHFKTESAHLDIDNKIIEGDSYIEGEGPTGKIMGDKWI